MKRTVLAIDDDPVDLKTMQMLLESWDLDVVTARSGEAGLQAIEKGSVDLVVSDVMMPGMSGVELVNAMRASRPDVPVILLTGQGDVRSAVSAMKMGAFDYSLKPPDEEEFRLTVERALEHGRLRRENDFLHAQIEVDGAYGDRLIGRSPRMQAVFDVINRVACTDSTVLVTGETGTGKELVAQVLHFRSRRSRRPLIALNCASLNSNLIESELFGHEKGAFTGATHARRGRFEDADGGTLFLDEISETTPEFQAKLLRVIQEGVFQRVGGNASVRADVRLIASTNRDLAAEVAAGRFREDLYYRLRVIPVELPPLRERGEDVLLLARHFMQEYARRYSVPVNGFSPAAERHLSVQPWKGNVRELQHTIERAVVLARRAILEPADLVYDEPATAASALEGTLEAFLDARTKEYVTRVLDRAGWSKKKAAGILGVDRVTLYRLLKKFSLEAGEGRG